MSFEFTEDQPIYRQLRNYMANAIIKGSLKEGDALPSVRTVAVDFQVNPLTASKAYQELVGEELVEKRRGLGMFVVEGARNKLLKAEQKQFLENEWPAILKRIHALEIDDSQLLESLSSKRNGK